MLLLTFQNQEELTEAEGCTRCLGTCGPGSRLDCLNDGWRRKGEEAVLRVSLSHFLPAPTPSRHLEPLFFWLWKEGRKLISSEQQLDWLVIVSNY